MKKFDCWKLESLNGRQFWQWSPEFEQSLTGNLLLDVQWWNSLEPIFDKKHNPNSADLAIRPQIEIQNSSLKNGNLKLMLESSFERGVKFFQTLQCEDGHWPGDYGGPHFLLPGLIIVSYCCGLTIPYPQKVLMVSYILNHQNEDGGWGMHIESDSTMFGTGLNYVALRLMGVPISDKRAQRALQWILKEGGIVSIPSWGKFYLAILGLFSWKGINPLLPELWLLPRWFPVHPSRIWCHARMVYLPMSYAYGIRFHIPENDLIRELKKELYPGGFDKVDWKQARYSCHSKDVYHSIRPIGRWVNWLMCKFEALGISRIRKRGLDFALSYIQAEDLQTNFVDIGPVNKVLNMLCVYIACGPQSEEFKKHMDRVKDYLWLAEDGLKMNGYNGSQLWDTAFATRALAESDHSVAAQSLKASFNYINLTQIREEVPLQKEFFRHPSVGGWPFSTLEHGWPITDCTSEALNAILTLMDYPHFSDVRQIDSTGIQAAADLILSFQNKDGGWASYELTRGPKWLEWLNPSEVFSDIMIDYSYVECTSSCLQALCRFHNKFPEYKKQEVVNAVRRGLRFLLKKQRPDGLWFGSWGVCFTYGSWFASQALKSVRQCFPNLDNDRILESEKRLGNALKKNQNPDGGWGEHYQSCLKIEWISCESQIVQTAWAALALQNISNPDKNCLKKGLEFLIHMQAEHGDWPQQRISGVFNKTCMITYSNYRNIFPLWALGRALKKNGENA